MVTNEAMIVVTKEGKRLMKILCVYTKETQAEAHLRLVKQELKARGIKA